MSEERKPTDPVTRAELHASLRFIYAMAMQGAEQVERIDAVLAALVRALLESGKLERQRVDALLPLAGAQVRERSRTEVSVDVAPAVDKYAVATPAELDCAALIPLCKGRCCRLTFPLSFQDLEEGGIQWNYARPYRIRQGDDGYCVHSEGATRRCALYQRRPAVCRSYDCRKDPRIWVDFERRIPALEDAIRPPVRLYDIRRPPGDGASRMDESPEAAEPAGSLEPEPPPG
jgi:Fe-S-cluster containining protein